MKTEPRGDVLIKVFNTNKAHKLAREYLLAFNRCINVRDFTYKGVPELLVIPSIVCAAFSAEISMKVIIFESYNYQAEGHGLKNLFEKLPLKIKDNIILQIKARDNFESLLGEINNAFEKWRYIYENPRGNSIAIEFLYEFAGATYRVSHDIVKSRNGNV